jgi:hypothetical protein
MRMNLSLAQRSLIAALNLSFTHFATAGNRGVVDGPDGYANLRKDKRADAPGYESQRNSPLPTAIFGGRAINFLATPILLFNQTPQLES